MGGTGGGCVLSRRRLRAHVDEGAPPAVRRDRGTSLGGKRVAKEVTDAGKEVSPRLTALPGVAVPDTGTAQAARRGGPPFRGEDPARTTAIRPTSRATPSPAIAEPPTTRRAGLADGGAGWPRGVSWRSPGAPWADAEQVDGFVVSDRDRCGPDTIRHHPGQHAHPGLNHGHAHATTGEPRAAGHARPERGGMRGRHPVGWRFPRVLGAAGEEVPTADRGPSTRSEDRGAGVTSHLDATPPPG